MESSKYEIYKYPKVDHIYAIKHKETNKIYNILNNVDYEPNSFLTGGIIMNDNKTDTVSTEFPYDILMDGYDKTYVRANKEITIYDSEIWSLSDISYIVDEVNKNKFSEPNSSVMNISLMKTIKKIKKEVDKIKQLYKDDDIVFKHQWFMDYVIFEEPKKSWLTIPENPYNTREDQIVNSMRIIHDLSKSFEINNNHQMKLFFQIFFNSFDSCKPINEIHITRDETLTNELTTRLKNQENEYQVESLELENLKANPVNPVDFVNTIQQVGTPSKKIGVRTLAKDAQPVALALQEERNKLRAEETVTKAPPSPKPVAKPQPISQPNPQPKPVANPQPISQPNPPTKTPTNISTKPPTEIPNRNP